MKEIILKYRLWILLAITVVAAFLRVYKIGTNPPSLTWDEAAWGYNAYSLGIDGKDEFGRFLPITYLESFGDFKPPVYAYLDILPIKIFGLNEFATRLPSAIFGTLTVFLTYFLTKRIFLKKEISNSNTEDSKLETGNSPISETRWKLEITALLAAIILAVSPWHIMLSRAAFEANVATFLLVLGIWSFLASAQEKKWYILISAASFALSMYTFNTSRVAAPLIVLALSIFLWKNLLKIKKQVVIALILGLTIFLPSFGFLLTPQANLRFREVNIFSDPSVVETANQEIRNDGGAIWSKLIHNRRVLYSVDFISHYLDNVNPLFLFIKGDGNPKFSIQSVGQMYLWEIITFTVGLFYLFKRRQGHWWIIPVWLVLGIIPAATARETPHALRIETTLPTFQIISAYGLIYLGQVISNIKYKISNIHLGYFVFSFFILFLIFNLSYFLHEYYHHYPYEYSAEWQYGYQDSINYVKSVEQNYDHIQVTSSLGRPYIYYLFYTRTNPTDFRKTAIVNRDPFGFVKVTSFGKYTFPDNYTYNSKSSGKTLYISTPYNLPKNINVIKIFKLLDGNPVLVAYE